MTTVFEQPFDLMHGLWQHVAPFLWITLYLLPTWGAGYLLKLTAPQFCPQGLDSYECGTEHMFHVLRHDSRWCLLLGLFWPAWCAVGVGWLAARSLDGAVAVTPTPRRRQPLDTAITAGTKTTEEILIEMEGKVIERFNDDC